MSEDQTQYTATSSTVITFTWSR